MFEISNHVSYGYVYDPQDRDLSVYELFIHKEIPQARHMVAVSLPLEQEIHAINRKLHAYRTLSRPLDAVIAELEGRPR